MRKKAQPNLTCQLCHNASTYTTQGRVKTHRDGSILNTVYQTTVAVKKTAQTMYKSCSRSVLLPPSKLNWKEVCSLVALASLDSRPRGAVRER